MTKLLASLAVFAITVGLSVAYMMLGWGLTPSNWWAIIGFGVVGNTIAFRLAKSLENDK